MSIGPLRLAARVARPLAGTLLVTADRWALRRIGAGRLALLVARRTAIGRRVATVTAALVVAGVVLGALGAVAVAQLV